MHDFLCCEQDWPATSRPWYLAHSALVLARTVFWCTLRTRSAVNWPRAGGGRAWLCLTAHATLALHRWEAKLLSARFSAVPIWIAMRGGGSSSPAIILFFFFLRGYGDGWGWPV